MKTLQTDRLVGCSFWTLWTFIQFWGDLQDVLPFHSPFLGQAKFIHGGAKVGHIEAGATKNMCVDRVGFTHDLRGSTIISRALIMNLVCFDADFSQL